MLVALLSIALGWVHADRVADSVANTSESNGARGVSSTYGRYLGCVNRLHPPWASALRISPEALRSQSPEQRPSIFAGSVRGKPGIVVISPGVATLDEVPGGKANPYERDYPFAYVAPDGTDQVWHYYVDSQTHRGSAASTGPDFRKTNPDVTFYPLSKPESLITETEGIEALVGEILPSLESMPESIRSFREYLKGRGRDSYDEDIEAALCACVKTGNPIIAGKALDVAKRLHMNGVNSCGSDAVSSLMKYLRLLPRAHAEAAPPRSTAELTFSTPVRAIAFAADALRVCTLNDELDVAITSSAVRARRPKCEIRAKPDSICADLGDLRDHLKGERVACVRSGNSVAVATRSQVLLVDLKTKKFEHLSDAGGTGVALTRGWMAWSHGAGVSVVKVR